MMSEREQEISDNYLSCYANGLPPFLTGVGERPAAPDQGGCSGTHLCFHFRDTRCTSVSVLSISVLGKLCSSMHIRCIQNPLQ